jgi:hypothetical protein
MGETLDIGISSKGHACRTRTSTRSSKAATKKKL